MDLDIDQDGRFQQHEWRIERVGWVLVAIFVLAGLLGFLGTGPVSRQSAADGVVRVEFDRVTHYEADDAVTWTFGPEAVEDATVTARLTGDWPAGVDIQGISPEPTEQRIVPGGVVLEFAVEQAGELEVSINFRAQQLGDQAGELSVGADSVPFAQFVLP
jgi:hypothetical protein